MTSIVNRDGVVYEVVYKKDVDRLHPATCRRDGDARLDHGLDLEMPPWPFHLSPWSSAHEGYNR